MKPHEIEHAARALSTMVKAAETLEALSHLEVLGIELSDGVKLSQGCSGTGSISSIGYPDDLQAAMTRALHDWAAKRLSDATDAAKAAGICIDGETP